MEFVEAMTVPIHTVAALANDRQGRAVGVAKLGPGVAVENEPGRRTRVGVYTSTDLEIQEMLLTFIWRRWPWVSILAEEETPTKLAFPRDQLYCVLLDPIDGTRNFLEGNSAFCHTVSLMEGSSMVASLVYSHLQGLLFHAVAGAGAVVSRADQAPRPLRLGATAARTFLHHVSRVPATVIEGLAKLGYRAQSSSQNATDILRMFEETTCGFISVSPVVYDVWSPAMIIQEAGGWVSDWLGQPPVFTGHNRLAHLLVARSQADAQAVLPVLCSALPAVGGD